ncbi:unnamed protein product [Discosporangium mesarthrocarpum]
MGLPIFIMGYLHGQEEGNVEFVRERGLGDYSSRPWVTVRKVSQWFQHQEELELMRANARKTPGVRASLLIARDIGDLLSIPRHPSGLPFLCAALSAGVGPWMGQLKPIRGRCRGILFRDKMEDKVKV